MVPYRRRLVDADIKRALRISGAVVLSGPRACGKTMSGRQHCASELRLDPSGPDLARAELDPAAALEAPAPLLIDEWQNLPVVWDAARRAVDDRRLRGQFIITGSAWPEDDARRHTGAGRFTNVPLRPMSLFESGQSAGTVGLSTFFHGGPEGTASTDARVGDYARWIARGGWPGWLELDDEDAAEAVQGYLIALLDREFPLVAGPRRRPAQLMAFLRAYAGLQAHPATLAALGRRISEEHAESTSRGMAKDFHRFAERMFIVEDLPAWSPNLRSRTPLVQLPKRYFIDPSLACAALGVGATRLLTDPETFGYLFEALVVRDLRCYAQAARMRGVYHLRDQKGRDEIDLVIEDRTGEWVGVEVKLGYISVAAAVANLRRVAASIARPPAALMVVVPSGRVARTPEGVWIVPLALLGP